MALDSTTNAAELTQETVVAQLVQPLSAASQFLAAGPRIIDTAGPVRIPKLGSSAVATPWIAQNELIPDSDVDFDEIQLLPSTMKSLKTLTKFSNELSRQSVIALDAAIQQKLVSDVAAAMDSQLFSASGDGVETPRGLFAYTGTQTLAVGGDPDPEPEPEPEPTDLDPLAKRVAAALARKGDIVTEELASEHLMIVRAFVYSYTRGRGFTDLDLMRPISLIESVIVSACMRLTPNPEQLESYTAGDYSERGARLQGFSLPELAVLNNYRRRTR